MKNRTGFTLIELLIVVAIIAILAAIAVPNFLEAQVRSKVARVKADMRSIATGLEAYAVDNNSYPYAQLPVGARDWIYPGGFPIDPSGRCSGITTPIAYLTSAPVDVFDTELLPTDGYQNALHYVGNKFGFNRATGFQSPMAVLMPTDAAMGTVGPTKGIGADTPTQNGINGMVPFPYVLYSQGPDKLFFLDLNGNRVKDGTDIASIYNLNNRFDATNGTVSPGNVVRFPSGADN
ncbi:MAG: prepilin-type N-terminal cleavage/methylation domain-containing protein [Candidatus Sumerlaeaceae bacterium]